MNRVTANYDRQYLTDIFPKEEGEATEEYSKRIDDIREIFPRQEKEKYEDYSNRIETALEDGTMPALLAKNSTNPEAAKIGQTLQDDLLNIDDMMRSGRFGEERAKVLRKEVSLKAMDALAGLRKQERKEAWDKQKQEKNEELRKRMTERKTAVKPDKPQWDSKLSQEQIDDLIEKGIYEPVGPEYEQALSEMVGLSSSAREARQPESVPTAGNSSKPATDIESAQQPDNATVAGNDLEPDMGITVGPTISVEARPSYSSNSRKDGENNRASAETVETVEEDEEERKINEDAEYFKDGFKPEMVEDENGKFSKEKNKKFTERISGFVDRIGNKLKSIREKRYKIAVRKKEIEQRLAKIKGNYSTPEQKPAPTIQNNSSASAKLNNATHNYFAPAGDLDNDSTPTTPNNTPNYFAPAGNLDDEEDTSSNKAEKNVEDDEIEDGEEDQEASQNFEESDAYEEYVNKEFKNLGENTIEFLTSTRPLDKIYAGRIFNWWTPAEPLNDEARARIIDLLKRSRGLPEGSAVRELLERVKIIQYEN